MLLLVYILIHDNVDQINFVLNPALLLRESALYLYLQSLYSVIVRLRLYFTPSALPAPILSNIDHGASKIHDHSLLCLSYTDLIIRINDDERLFKRR